MVVFSLRVSATLQHIKIAKENVNLVPPNTITNNGGLEASMESGDSMAILGHPYVGKLQDVDEETKVPHGG